MFLALSVYLVKITVYDSKDFIYQPTNPRLSQSREDIKRGSVLDCKGQELAYSQKEGDSYKRVYLTEGNLSHILGYVDNGKSGIEAYCNFDLETVDFEIMQQISSLLGESEVRGNNVYLTIDLDVQKAAAESMGDRRGSVVAIEPESGKIISMLSNPTFDSNTIKENWDELNADEDNSPLLNRATQGLYPPGSTFKIITAAAALSTDPALGDFEYRCLGEADFGDTLLHCFNSAAHGYEDMTDAFAKSCNTYFATVAQNIGNNALIEATENFCFNKPIDFPLPAREPIFSLKPSSQINELAETAIGQGKTLVTPLYMAMVTSAIAYNGMMMQPHIIDRIESPFNTVKYKASPVLLSQVCSPDNAFRIKNMMISAVNEGTATQSQLYVNDEPVQAAGKTGTAENASGEDHSWFVAFAPADDPKIAVAVILENSGHGDRAEYIAKNVMETYLEK